MTIATMATFPSRRKILINTLENIADQVDTIYLTLNEYTEIPEELARFKNVVPKIPDIDHKDVGKFLYKKYIKDDDYVLTLDDDILYPSDYVKIMKKYYDELPFEKKVLGVHGIIYSDFFDGQNKARIVYSFPRELLAFKCVNQLGTGTIITTGECLPSFEYMEDATKFVDLRMSKYLYENNIPSICVVREESWLSQFEFEDEGIYSSFTTKWPNKVLHEAIKISGLSKINIEHLKEIDSTNKRLGFI